MLIVTQGKKGLLPGVVKLALSQVHGGVWWCVVVCPFVNSYAGQEKAAAGGGQAGSVSGAWWCMVVCGGVSRGACWCMVVSMLKPCQAPHPQLNLNQVNLNQVNLNKLPLFTMRRTSLPRLKACSQRGKQKSTGTTFAAITSCITCNSRAQICSTHTVNYCSQRYCHLLHNVTTVLARFSE